MNPSTLIAFVLPDLVAGGAERVVLDLSGELLRRGHRVDLLLGRNEGELRDSVSAGIRLLELGVTKLRDAIQPLREYLAQERPDVIRADLWPLTSLTAFAAAGSAQSPKIAVCDHAPLTEQYASSLLQTLKLRISIFATYRKADAIIGVSDMVSAELANLAGVARDRVNTIYNPVPPPLLSGRSAQSLWGESPGKRVLTVGRLKSVKNHSLLIAAFECLLSEQHSTLAIVGEGEERAALERLVRERGLEGRVLMPGFSRTPGDWYTSADVFVLTSEFEGFGNVLVEAMHFGLPIVSTDCPGGPREILEDGKWGWLVNEGSAAELAQVITKAMNGKVDQVGLRRRALEFSVDRAVDAFEALVFEPASSRS